MSKSTRSSSKRERFSHKDVEKKWQKKWVDEGTFYPQDMLKVPAENKFYNLWMFPYPSAEGLHAGHAFASTGSDIYGKYMRMKGKETFQPIGYDSFGIHSENFALKIGEQPKTMLDRTTKHYADQLKSLGHGYDWTRTVTTSDVDYYRWTQWLFIEMYKAGLAYRRKATVNWCPKDLTVLADEQVMTPKQAGKEATDKDGNPVADAENVMVCERCGTVAEKKELEQWFFRITDYAEKLLNNLQKIDWPEKIKIAQTNWIGKKEGINITYKIKDTDETITVWTSRPDTNFGATFVVVAPEFAQEYLLDKAPGDKRENIKNYIERSLNKSRDERIAEGKEKTGEFTGLYAVNQLNGYEMPIWVTDFVLMDVGTGAVVGVPGHDMRDFQFATTFKLPIKRVVVGSDGDASEIKEEKQVQESEGKMVNSEFLDGIEIHEATQKMMDHLEKKGWGKRMANYHLRDWLISRQRYWGPPIPMIHCEACAKAGKSWFTENKDTKALHADQSDWDSVGWYPEENLPVELPYLEDYKPEGNGKGPLAKLPEFCEVACPVCGGKATRETDVSDTFLDSSWYYLRYPSVGANSASKMPFDVDITKKWLPVDLYFGGAEHAVLHLMYSRFVTMVLNNLDYLAFEEPFPRFFAHGLMIKDGAKMSKSRGNVVNPDEYIEKFGADTLRLYLMFMGPMDGYPDFRDTGIEGMRRFVDRLWELLGVMEAALTKDEENELEVVMHQTIKRVTDDIEGFRYNTAIAALMEFVNLLRSKVVDKSTDAAEKGSPVWVSARRSLILLLAPFAPHLSEEVWQNEKTKTDGSKFQSVHRESWPAFDPGKIKEQTLSIVIQVNGKLRGTLELDVADAKEKEKVLGLAREDEKIAKWLEGKKVVKEIYVPSKLVNFVISQ